MKITNLAFLALLSLSNSVFAETLNSAKTTLAPDWLKHSVDKCIQKHKSVGNPILFRDEISLLEEVNSVRINKWREADYFTVRVFPKPPVPDGPVLSCDISLTAGAILRLVYANGPPNSDENKEIVFSDYRRINPVDFSDDQLNAMEITRESLEFPLDLVLVGSGDRF